MTTSNRIKHEVKYRKFAADRNVVLTDLSLQFFNIRDLNHLKQLIKEDENLNNVSLLRFDLMTISYNNYNRTNRITFSEGTSMYKQLLLDMVRE